MCYSNIGLQKKIISRNVDWSKGRRNTSSVKAGSVIVIV